MCMCRGGWAADYATMMSLSDSSSPFSSASDLGRGGLGVGCRRLLFGDENVVAFRPTRVAVGRSGVVGRGPVVGPLNDFDVIIGVGPALAAGRFGLLGGRVGRFALCRLRRFGGVGRDGHLLSVFHLSDALFHLDELLGEPVDRRL